MEQTIEAKLKGNQKEKITIVGSGAWGTAIGHQISYNKRVEVTIYGINEEEINEINKSHTNKKYFSTKLSKNLFAASDKEQAFKNADIIMLVLPSVAVKAVVEKDIVPNMKKAAYFVNLAKGLDYLKVQLLSDVIKEAVPSKLRKGVLKLTGPSFAIDVANGEPTLLTLASDNIDLSKKISQFLETDKVHIEPKGNLNGAEALSVIKNPYAVMMGIIQGLGYQMNSKAFLFTKIVEEMIEVLKLFGIENPEKAIISAAGLGDFFLTGTSLKSRNFSTGYKIGKADKVTKKILQSFTTIEGLKSIELLNSLAIRKKITLEIIEMLYNIAYRREKPSQTVEKFFNK